MKTKKIKLEITSEEANLLLRLVKQHKEKTCPIVFDYKELQSYVGEGADNFQAWIEAVTCEQRVLCGHLENKLMR